MDLPVYYSQCSANMRRLVRAEYERIQDGKCSYCKEPLSGPAAKHVKEATINLKLFPPMFLRWPVHLHHDHGTDLTIGAVHARCNAYLWQYKGE